MFWLWTDVLVIQDWLTVLCSMEDSAEYLLLSHLPSSLFAQGNLPRVAHAVLKQFHCFWGSHRFCLGGGWGGG